MEKLSFTVADYDAPLDLILHLLSKHKLNILDIDISSLLEQYMAIISQWQSQDLEVASEFLEMASRLVYIKTVSLLPKHEDEHDKLRQELSGQLIEYSICKKAAGTLGELYVGRDIFVREAMTVEADQTYALTHPASLLYEAYADAMGKGARRLPPPAASFDPLVTKPIVSVTAKIFTVLRALRADGQVSLDRLYGQSRERSGVIATFLALLELVKSKKVRIHRGEVSLNKTSPR